MLNKNIFAVLTGVGMLFCTITNAQAEAPALTEAEVKKIVQQFIMDNPEVILDSVQKYQEGMSREKQQTAIKENQKELYHDKTPMAGNANGDVTIIEFFDYNCGYCKKAFAQVNEVLQSDKNIRFLFKEFPILGETSETASKWALAAQKQDKYFAFYSKMMDNRSPITDELLEKTAKEIGMDVGKAKADIESTDVLLQIKENRSLAQSMGISGTPAFVIGEEVVPGAVDTKTLQDLVAKARAVKAK